MNAHSKGRLVIDPILLNDWHPIADTQAIRPRTVTATMLLDTELELCRTGEDIAVSRLDGAPLHSCLRHGLVWACLGEPAAPVIDIPEATEADRRIVTGGGLGVHASAPRVVDNFLDIGHLASVHDGYLGAADQAEIANYTAAPLPGGGFCVNSPDSYQPYGTPGSKEGLVVQSFYRIERPLTVCVYKTSLVDPSRFEGIYLFCQPVSQDRTVAFVVNAFVADSSSIADLRWFQQLIFLQDKVVLENQVPKRLPLAPVGELSLKSDLASVTYRRWLTQIGLRYGVIPSP